MPTELHLCVSDIRAEARDVLLIELRARNDGALPPFTPGAHLEITLPNQQIRHYSLANDCRERDRYLIGVGRAADSRGGSDFVHRLLRCGAEIRTSEPRNNFQLDSSAAGYIFVAGGIGITPIMSMVRWCAANDRAWQLYYAARSRQRAAFYEDLREFGKDRVRFHFDEEEGSLLNASDIIDRRRNEQIYCCGPQPLMQAIGAAAADLPAGSVKFEYFTAPAPETATQKDEGSFNVRLKRSGSSFNIPPDKSILEVLEANGFNLPFSCREGLCRTCETRVCAGEIDHRDYVLSDEEQKSGDTMMICVSRAKAQDLILDL